MTATPHPNQLRRAEQRRLHLDQRKLQGFRQARRSLPLKEIGPELPPALGGAPMDNWSPCDPFGMDDEALAQLRKTMALHGAWRAAFYRHLNWRPMGTLALRQPGLASALGSTPWQQSLMPTLQAAPRTEAQGSLAVEDKLVAWFQTLDEKKLAAQTLGAADCQALQALVARVPPENAEWPAFPNPWLATAMLAVLAQPLWRRPLWASLRSTPLATLQALLGDHPVSEGLFLRTVRLCQQVATLPAHTAAEQLCPWAHDPWVAENAVDQQHITQQALPWVLTALLGGNVVRVSRRLGWRLPPGVLERAEVLALGSESWARVLSCSWLLWLSGHDPAPPAPL